MKTLIVEDELNSRLLYEEQLRVWGYEVTACADAETALEMYQQTFSPLIVLDLGLPGMDGLELCRRIRALPQGDRSIILVITAHDTSGDLQATLDAGADDYMIKPVSTEQLNVRLKILERQIENRARQKQTEEGLRQLKKAVETMQVGVTITDTNGKIVYTNPAEAAMHGYQVEDLIGKDLGIFAPPELRKPLPPDQIKAMPHRVRESINVRKDGTIFPVRLIFDALSTVEGAPIGIVTISEDITERKQREDILREEKKKARTYLDIAGVIIIVIHADQTVSLINKKGCQILGYNQAEVLGRNWFDQFIPEKDRESVKAVFNKLMIGELESVEYFENTVLTKDGKERVLAWHNTVLTDESGRIIGTLSSGEDITDRKQAEQAIRASELQYRLLAEHVADGIGIIQDGKLVFVNEALTFILGFTSDHLVEMNPVDLFHDDHKRFFKRTLAQIERGIFNEYLQAVCLTGDNREIWIEERHSLIEWAKKPAIIFTMRDITEHKLHELAIEEEKDQLKKVNVVLRSTMKDRYRFGEIIGKSPAMQEVYELIANAAASDANVVIHGESGTGKELVAWTIHYLSTRKEKVFAPVNCGAVTESLFESAFFGHRKGSFTGAHKDKSGFFDHAHGGSLFLDEVGELSLSMQIKFLRVLAGGGHTPVGDHTVRKADVRIIVATNRNLEDMVKQGTLRRDFFFRINVIPITVPPLRERREDIPLLIEHFLEQYSVGKQKPTLPGTILEQLYRYNWPGNVRELQNVLQRYLTTKRLDFTDIVEAEPVGREETSGAEITVQEGLELHQAVEEFEKRYIANILEQHRWHRGKTATTLGIDPRTLYRKIKDYRLS